MIAPGGVAAQGAIQMLSERNGERCGGNGWSYRCPKEGMEEDNSVGGRYFGL